MRLSDKNVFSHKSVLHITIFSLYIMRSPVFLKPRGIKIYKSYMFDRLTLHHHRQNNVFLIASSNFSLDLEILNFAAPSRVAFGLQARAARSGGFPRGRRALLRLRVITGTALGRRRLLAALSPVQCQRKGLSPGLDPVPIM